MIEVLQSVIAFIIVLGVLITFHEFGHYWLAKCCDVKILRFSIGFGRPLYKRCFGKDNTEFVIAALPLGGYVKMLDERETEVKEEELPRAFNSKTLTQRFAIVAAGPVFNFIFAVFAYCLVFIIGVNGLKPIIGDVKPDSISAHAGLMAGDELIEIADTRIKTWASAIDKLINHTVKGEAISVRLMDNKGIEHVVELDLSRISIDEMAEGRLLEGLGLKMIDLSLPAVIGELIPGGVAERQGLLPYDEVISVNGAPIASWQAWVDVIQASPEKSLDVEILRGEKILKLGLSPESSINNGREIGRIGASVFKPDGLFDAYFVKETYPLHQALIKAIDKTWEMSMLTLRVLGKMLIGEASVKNLSGPISIAQYAGQSAGMGWVAFLSFMAIVSLSLGVLNLLPIPLLDGGHLLYYLVEFITGKPVSEQIQLTAQQVGIVLLLGLMTLVFYNDISRLLG